MVTPLSRYHIRERIFSHGDRDNKTGKRRENPLEKDKPEMEP
jgi:hypothetical protein